MKYFLFLFLTFLGCKGTEGTLSVGYEPATNTGTIEAELHWGRCTFSPPEEYNQFPCNVADYKAISYSVIGVPFSLTREEYKWAADTAFQIACNLVPELRDLDYYEVGPYDHATLKIGAYSRNELDPFHSFDGAGNVLGHTYHVCYYDCEMRDHIFLDSDEEFATVFSEEKIWVVKVLVHELLHWFGLRHNNIDRRSIVFPQFLRTPEIYLTKEDLRFFSDNY